MSNECTYGFGKIVALSFDEAVARVSGLLRQQGFHILSQIDLQKNLQECLGIDFRKYQILGACKSEFAYQAFSADQNIGLLLPCNVIVYETDEGQVRVMAMDPLHVMELINNPEAIEVTMELKKELEAVMEEI
jgi:uncharacterized protein (DUF302 family)